MTSQPSSSRLADDATGQTTWNLQQICDNANNWSLQGDAQLLAIMQGISKNLEQRCTTTKANIDNMLRSQTRANLRLENTTNKMLSLKNLQFIEARVNDEVEHSANSSADNVRNGSSISETLTPILAVRTAVDNGLKMLNKYYEKVALKLDDDDDDDDSDGIANQSSFIFRSRNPHQDRPLPHLIGSKEWVDKWHVGLLEDEYNDDDDDDEEDETEDNDNNANPYLDDQQSPKQSRADEFSTSEDDETNSVSVSCPSNSQTISGSEYSDSHRSSIPSQLAHGPGPNTMPNVEQVMRNVQPKDLFDSDSDSDGGARISHSGNVNVNAVGIQQIEREESVAASSRQTSIRATPEPSKVATKHDPRTENVGNHIDSPSSIFRQPPVANKRTNIVSGLFDDEPPELPAASISRKPANLFLDDDTDDDDNLFVPKSDNQSKSVAVEQPPTKTAVISKGIFDSSDSEPEESVPEVRHRPELPTSMAQPIAKSNIGNLFDDSPTDDLFDVLISKKPAAHLPKTMGIVDDFDELFGRKSIVDAVRSESTTRTSGYKDNNAATTKLFDDDDENDDLFAHKRTIEKPTDPILENPKPTSLELAPSASIISQTDKPHEPITENKPPSLDIPPAASTYDSLFGDEDSEDFASIFSKPKPKLQIPHNQTSLFNDIESDNEYATKPMLDVESSQSTAGETIRPLRKEHISDDLSTIATHSETHADLPDESAEHDLEPPMQKETSSKSSSPEQFANFYTTNESAKLVEDRRPFVSYLDNESQPDFDEWDVKSGNLFGTNDDVDDANSSKTLAVDKGNRFAPLPIDGTVIPPSADKIDNDGIAEQPMGVSSTITLSDSAEQYDSELVVDSEAAASKSKYSTRNTYLFDDEPPEDDFEDIFSTSAAKPKTSTMTHAAFFDTLPPPDDDDDRNSTSHIGRQQPMQSRSVALFDDFPPDDDDVPAATAFVKTSSVGVFDELPPPDDESNAALYEKRSSTSVAYDSPPEDASITVESSHSITTAKKVFYEDFDDTITLPPKFEAGKLTSRSSNEIDRTNSDASGDSFRDRLSKFANPSSEIVDIETSADVTKRKPGKLHSNLKINVAALLPGAKLMPPISSESSTGLGTNRGNDVATTISSMSSNLTGRFSTVETSDDVTDNVIAPHLDDTTDAAIAKRPDSCSGLLDNLNKGRAKIAVKRRPPTRQGLRNEFRKSLLASEEMLRKQDERTDMDDDDVVQAESNATSPAALTPIVANTIALPNRSASEALFGDVSDDDDDDLFGSSKKPTGKLDVAATSQSHVPSVNKDDGKFILKKSSLFSVDDDSDDGDLFGTKVGPQRIAGAAAAVSASRKANVSLFGDDDDDDDDDLFGKKTYLDHKRAPPKPKAKANAATSKSTSSTPTQHDPLAGNG